MTTYYGRTLRPYIFGLHNEHTLWKYIIILNYDCFRQGYGTVLSFIGALWYQKPKALLGPKNNQSCSPQQNLEKDPVGCFYLVSISLIVV